MAVPILATPFDAQVVEEINLASAPLMRVLTQLRHPAMSILIGDTGVNLALRIAERMSKQYPIFETTQEAGLVVSSRGIEPTKGTSTIWRLRSADEMWQISLNQGFFSLETRVYEGRRDFLERFRDFLTVYLGEVELPSISRIGIRYTNRIDDPDSLSSLPKLVRPELLGPAASESQLPADVDLASAYSQAQFTRGADGLLLNQGLLPPNAVLDVTLPAVPHRSWVLDIDSYRSTKIEFDPSAVLIVLEELAAQAYQCFRWAVTEDFIEMFRAS